MVRMVRMQLTKSWTLLSQPLSSSPSTVSSRPEVEATCSTVCPSWGEEVEEVAGEARAVPPRVRSRVGGGAPPALSQVRVRRSPAAAVVARTPPTPRVREGGGAGPRGEGVG